MTRCAFVEARLRSLIDGELSLGESTRVLAHLEACAACRQAYAQTQAVVSMLQETELEDAPAHFTASLQVRLAGLRSARAASRNRFAWLRPVGQWSRRRWAGGLTTAALALSLTAFLLTQGIGAAEVARRAEQSWSTVRNYGCVFVSRGVYQGKPRVFTQRQFFRRPDEFRLETAQDYPLTTFVFPNQVIHELRGGDWEGKGPLVIIRPRREGEQALPFPFGVTWQGGGNVSMDQLIRQLRENEDAELLGTEPVGGQECYHVRFEAAPPGGHTRDQYEMWIDKTNFLPRRVSWYRDAENHIETEATELQVNNTVLPAGTFNYQAPEGAFIIRGDVDPHVFALKPDGGRPARFDYAPISSASHEVWERRRSVPFRVFAPEWLPEDFKLVRVRRAQGRWVDMYWIRDRGADASQVVKLVEQAPGATLDADLLKGELVNLGTERQPMLGRLLRRTEPYDHTYVTWIQGGTRFTLFAAELELADVKRIARSMARAMPPPRPVFFTSAGPISTPSPGEPSVAPTEEEGLLSSEPALDEPLPAPATAETEQPPMMPEMADDDQRAAPITPPSAATTRPAAP